MSTHINIGDFLTTRAHLNPDKEAIFDVEAGIRLNFTQLNHRANQVCAGLSELGLKKGDRVALLAYNGHEFVESFFGPAKAGLVVMPLNWRLTADELAFILQDGGAKAIIYHADFKPVVEQLRAMGTDLQHWIQIDGDTADGSLDFATWQEQQTHAEPPNKAGASDNLFIMYTSGTTGLPKGVVHTHDSQLWAVLTSANSSDGRFSDRYMVLLPLFHVGALTPMITMVYAGITLVVLRNFDPTVTWELIQSESINITLAVPAMLSFMLQVPDLQRFDWSSLRWIMSGAAPVPVSTINAYKELGLEIHQVYGLTETCGPACMISPDDAMSKIGSTGKSFFHTDVKIVGEQGEEVAAGEPGEVAVRGRHTMKEYWNRPEATAETLRDGWLYTGDIAIQDENGFVYIQDRIKDMIISGGENVYPAEIENVLLQHEGIADAAVIGQDSEKWGESPFAIIVRNNSDLSEDEVLAHCNGKLARFKLPKAAVFIDAIPRNPSGKVLKRLLREQYPRSAAE